MDNQIEMMNIQTLKFEEGKVKKLVIDAATSFTITPLPRRFIEVNYSNCDVDLSAEGVLTLKKKEGAIVATARATVPDGLEVSIIKFVMIYI